MTEDSSSLSLFIHHMPCFFFIVYFSTPLPNKQTRHFLFSFRHFPLFAYPFILKQQHRNNLITRINTWRNKHKYREKNLFEHKSFRKHIIKRYFKKNPRCDRRYYCAYCLRNRFPHVSRHSLPVFIQEDVHLFT